MKYIASHTALLAGAAVLLAGCGVETQSAGRSARSSTTPEATTTTNARGTTGPARPARLPQRPAGTLALATQGEAFSDRLVNNFEGSSDVNVAATTVNAATSYAQLCSGRVDVIQTAAAPTVDDYRACSARGLTIADPIQLGSEAVVLATKNQSDVGGDCITVRQARDLFRSGSQYTNWNQLGFDDLKIRAAGREDGSDGFRFFGQEVLGLTNATLGDVRSDYLVRTTDARERKEVTDETRSTLARRKAAAYAKRLRASTSRQRRQYVDRAIADSDRRVNVEIRRVNARNKRLKINVNGPALIRSNARLAARSKRDAAVRANLVFDARLNKRILAYRDKLVRAADIKGSVGPFSFSYYQLFEERLRPLEIDYGTPETKGGTPVRFGDLTAADQRRLAPEVRASVAQQTGRQVASSAATARRTAAGATGTTGAVSDIDPDTTLPAVDDLPSKTDNGLTIYPSPNCVFPSQVTISTGSYPLTRRIFYVTTEQGLKRTEVRSFLKSALDNVQGLAPTSNFRLVPITDLQRRTAYIEVTGAPPGDQPAVEADSGATGATGSNGTTGATGATGSSGASVPSGGIPGVSSGRG